MSRSVERGIREAWTGARTWVLTTVQLWPGSVRLLVCAAGLWMSGLIGLGPWALFAVPVLLVVGFGCLARHHHLGVVIIMFACLFAVQLTTLSAARGPAEDAEVEGIIVGHSTPGASGWSRLTVLRPSGISEVLAPSVPPDGARVVMHTTGLDDIRLTETAPRVLREPNAAWGWRAAVRTALSQDSAVSGHDGGRLLPGLVIGDTQPQDERMVETMRVVSLTHISAVSGSNVTIVSLGAGLLAGAARAGPRTRVSVGVATCAGYVFVVGFEPSAIRAAGMALAVALVFLRGGGIAPVAVLCSTVSVLVGFVPVLASSVGFVLSVVSTAAIMFVVPILLRRLSIHLPLVPSVIITALVVPLVAQLACTPVLVAIDPRIGLWSVAANALAAPAVMPATVLGFLSMLCAGLGILGVPGLEWFAQIPAWLGALPAWWIVAVARICAGLPGAALDWPAPPWGTLIALGLLVALAAGTVLLVRRRLWGLPVVVVCIAVTAMVVVTGRTKGPNADWAAIVCDVGQGSATVVNLGGGRGLVVDTGRDATAIDACLDDAGIEDFDLVISHFDDDHVGGSAGTTWSRTVGRIWVSGNVVAGPETSELATATGAEVVPALRGQMIDLGGVGESRVRVEVLWPPARGSSTTADEGVRNEDSLVLRVDQGELSYLIPGDIGEQEQYVIAQSVEPVDVLIAPHHGSGDLSPDFYARASAHLGVISVGENSYGHPTPKSVQAFGPVLVLRTDRCGSIALYASGQYSTGRDCHPGGDES